MSGLSVAHLTLSPTLFYFREDRAMTECGEEYTAVKLANRES